MLCGWDLGVGQAAECRQTYQPKRQKERDTQDEQSTTSTNQQLY